MDGRVFGSSDGVYLAAVQGTRGHVENDSGIFFEALMAASCYGVSKILTRVQVILCLVERSAITWPLTWMNDVLGNIGLNKNLARLYRN